MKKIYIILPTLFLIGCGVQTPTKTAYPKQHSIAQQQINAQNAWDELDGKTVTINKKIQNTTTNSIKTYNKTKQTIKSSLEKADSIPDWFYAPPKSNKYFYGAGEGDTTKQAQSSALDLIAREIQTTISSDLSISQGYTGSNTNVYQSVQNNINTEVQKIKFSNIEIMKTVKVGNKIYTLVRVDKQQLFNSLKNEFETLDKKIDTQIQQSQKYSLLDQLITLNKIKPEIKKAISIASILNTLNPNFDNQKYINKYNNYLNKKIKILHQLTFSVSPNNLFSQKLIEVLNQNGYKISNHSNIKINIQKQVRNSNIMGLAVARVTVNIQVLAKNKILSSTSLEVKGISNNSKQALAKAANNFKQKLQKENINKLLGLE